MQVWGFHGLLMMICWDFLDSVERIYKDMMAVE